MIFTSWQKYNRKMKNINLKIIALIFVTSLLHAQKTEKKMKETIPNSFEIISDHIDEFFDDSNEIIVLDEVESELIVSNVYLIKANDKRPYHILLSCGMSALPMSVPKSIESSKFVEVVMLLPKEWIFSPESFDDEKYYWPVRIIKEISRLPHKNKTWLGINHTYSAEDRPDFAPGIGLNSVILTKSKILLNDFTNIETEDNAVVQIYSLIPLYAEELEYKRKNGAQALLELLEKSNVTEVVNIGRQNVCK
jgi:hypothetical protein